MPETTTKTGSEDRRPKRAEEVWIAIGPFSRAGKAVVYGSLGLLALLLFGIWYEIHGIRSEQTRMRVGQELRGTPPKGG